MAGFDPILDGTAAFYTEYRITVLTYKDGSRAYEVTFPDAEPGFFETFDAMAHAIGTWAHESEEKR